MFFVGYFGKCTAQSGVSSNSAAVYFQKGLIAEKNFQIFTAKQLLKKACKLNSGNIGYKERYAWFLLNYDFIEDAVVTFNELVKLGKNVEWHAGLGWSKKKIGDLEGAANSLQKKYYSSQLQGASLQQSFAIIGRLADKENLEQIRKLQDQIKNHPKSYALHLELFNRYYYRSDFANVVEIASRIPESQQNMVFVIYYTDSLVKTGRITQAIAEFKRLVKKNSRSAYLCYVFGKSMLESNQLQLAEQLLRQSLLLYPNNGIVEATLVKALALQHKCEAALKLSSSIVDDERLFKKLAIGNANLYCKKYRESSLVFKSLIDQYKYNDEALWGLFVSSAKTYDFANQCRSFDRLRQFHLYNINPQQNKLIQLYRPPVVNFNYESFKNSGEFQRNAVGSDVDAYVFDKTRASIGYNYARFSNPGFSDVSRNSFVISGQSQLFENTGFGVKLISNSYNSPLNKATNINVGVSLAQRLLQNVVTFFTYRHYDLIDEQAPFANQLYNWANIGAVGLNIKNDMYNLGLLYDDWKKITLYGGVTYGYLSDSNREISRVFSVGYRLLPAVKVEYSYFYMDFAKPASMFVEKNNSTSAYFDPMNFEAHTLRVVFDRTFAEKWNVGLEGSVSLIPKNKSIGESVFGFISYKLTDSFTASLRARYAYVNKSFPRTGTDDRRFWANNVVLSFGYRF